MLSVCMIVQDEEVCIARALDSIHNYGIVSEIIVLDGGSLDKTKEIATLYSKVKFYEYTFDPLNGDRMDDQRNRAIDLTIEDWILFLDADEYYDDYTMNSLETLIKDTQYDAFFFSRKNIIDNQLTNLYAYDYQCRLFRRYCKYEGRMHEGVVGFKNHTEVNLDIKHHKTSEWQQKDNERCWDLGQKPFTGWEKIDGRWIFIGKVES